MVSRGSGGGREPSVTERRLAERRAILVRRDHIGQLLVEEEEEDSLSNDQSWRSAMAVTEGMIEVVIMNYCTVENSVLTF